jgi:HlyD family secretion protein
VSRTLVRVGVLLAVVAAVAAGTWWLTRTEPVAVRIAKVDRGLVEATVANTRAGTVEACQRSKIAPVTGGRVAEQLVREGDRVKAGEPLLVLWNRDLEARRELTRRELDVAEAGVEETCLRADLAVREARRLERLGEEGIVGEQAVDQARSQRDASAAACRAARARLEEARASIGLIDAELEKTVVRAPFDGVVAEVNAEVGEVATPSPPGIPTPPTIDLIGEGCLYVLAPIDEVDAPQVRVGLPARVLIDAFPGRSFPGTVRRVAPYVLDREKQSRTVDVEVELDDPGAIPGLVAGYSADVEIILERKPEALRIPTEALMEGDRVLVLADGRLVEREVETGLSNWDFTEIVGGLERGDRVVTSLGRAGVAAGADAVLEDESPADAPS